MWLAIELNRLNDLTKIIGHRDGPVREAGAADAAAAEDFVELVLVRRVIGDGGGGVFELMAGEDADDPLVGADDALIAEEAGTGDAGGAGGLTAEAAGGDFGFGVEHFLVRNLADDSLHVVQRPEALAEIHGAVDFDGAGDGRGFAAGLIEFTEVVVGDCHVGTAVVPAQAALLIQFIERVGTRRIDDGQTRDSIDEA